MRLPRSSSQPLSIRLFSFSLLLTAAIVLPWPARAATTQTTPQLFCEPTHLKFGKVMVGQSETQVIVLTNTGKASTTVSAVSLSSSDFNVSGLSLPTVLAPGASVALKATFVPTGSGLSSGRATFTSNATNPGLQLGFTGTGVTTPDLSASPANVSFGQVAVGSTASRSVTLTNTRSTKEMLQGLQLVGSEFTVSGPALPVALGPGQSVTVGIVYAPAAAGTTGGSLFVSGPALNIPLSGSGTTIGQLAISPVSLSFGNVLVGQTDTQTGVLTATGGSVTISSAASSNSEFVLPGASFPLTIAAGQSIQFNVAFTPTKAGAASAKIAFSSDASNSQLSESLAGVGTAPMVSLGWSASTSQVQGYNVYRGTAPGTYSRINPALDANTVYTDLTVASGATYYYAATAVNSSGQESTYSAPVKVVVP